MITNQDERDGQRGGRDQHARSGSSSGAAHYQAKTSSSAYIFEVPQLNDEVRCGYQLRKLQEEALGIQRAGVQAARTDGHYVSPAIQAGFHYAEKDLMEHNDPHGFTHRSIEQEMSNHFGTVCVVHSEDLMLEFAVRPRPYVVVMDSIAGYFDPSKIAKVAVR